VEKLTLFFSEEDYKMLYEHTDKVLLGDVFAAICDLVDYGIDVSEYSQDIKEKVLSIMKTAYLRNKFINLASKQNETTYIEVKEKRPTDIFSPEDY
jgi:hypothetical protein